MDEGMDGLIDRKIDRQIDKQTVPLLTVHNARLIDRKDHNKYKIAATIYYTLRQQADRLLILLLRNDLPQNQCDTRGITNKCEGNDKKENGQKYIHLEAG